MNNRIAKIVAVASAISALAIAATPASASVVVGGYTFADTAFADAVVATGNFSTNAASVQTALTDKDVNSYVLGTGTLDFSFLDNVVVNGSGNDLALFELGSGLDGWQVTINNITRGYTSAFTGYQGAQYQINAATVDLSDFGIAIGGTISSLRLTQVYGVSTSLVGALNSRSPVAAVPEPSTWAMMLAGFAMMGMAMRRRRASKTVLAFA